ncbi:MAG: DMT family transporter [Alphaproteobacteria bacterium]|nr:DMT family transporter [Alphaproteobacteria bacterium]
MWALNITVAMSLAKRLDSEINSFVLVFFRCSFGFMFTLPFIYSEGLEKIKTKRFSFHFLRMLFNASGLLCTYYAYRHLPLAEATAIGFTEPLVTILLAALILKDRLTLAKWIGVIGGYIGVFVIVSPHTMVVNNAFYVLLLANILASSSLICTKILSKTDSTIAILTYTNILSVFFAAVAVVPYWKMPDLHNSLLLLGVGFFGILSQFSYIKALKHADPSFLAPFEYTRLLMAIPIGIMFFNETPSAKVFIGAGIIILATYALAKLERS